MPNDFDFDDLPDDEPEMTHPDDEQVKTLADRLEELPRRDDLFALLVKADGVNEPIYFDRRLSLQVVIDSIGHESPVAVENESGCVMLARPDYEDYSNELMNVEATYLSGFFPYKLVGGNVIFCRSENLPREMQKEHK